MVPVPDRERVKRFIRSTLQNAGRQVTEAKESYREGKTTAQLPRDDKGRVRLVCRRYAERRAVRLDSEGRPACFDADHPDCRGCAEDVQEGIVETW